MSPSMPWPSPQTRLRTCRSPALHPRPGSWRPISAHGHGTLSSGVQQNARVDARNPIREPRPARPRAARRGLFRSQLLARLRRRLPRAASGGRSRTPPRYLLCRRGAAGSASTNSSIRRRSSGVGKCPVAAPMLSTAWCDWVVPGIAAVTAGCETTYLRKN